MIFAWQYRLQPWFRKENWILILCALSRGRKKLQANREETHPAYLAVSYRIWFVARWSGSWSGYISAVQTSSWTDPLFFTQNCPDSESSWLESYPKATALPTGHKAARNRNSFWQFCFLWKNHRVVFWCRTFIHLFAGDYLAWCQNSWGSARPAPFWGSAQDIRCPAGPGLCGDQDKETAPVDRRKGLAWWGSCRDRRSWWDSGAEAWFRALMSHRGSLYSSHVSENCSQVFWPKISGAEQRFQVRQP